MADGFARNVKLWVVHVDAHHVPPRWDVPEFEGRIGGTESEARRLVAEKVSCDAGVPPWKPLRAVTLAYTRVVEQVEELVK